MIGRTLGSYRILEQIGMGGMATVYKAYDPATDRYVAVKVLPEHYSQDPQFRARFEREARAIARLEHPFILPIHAYGEEDGIAYLVMRYLPTGTLKDRIARGSIDLAEANAILAQVAAALDYAHEHHILHRDIKPSNILLDDRWNAFLTDFGIAKMVEATVDLTGGGILGTPAYMSPEQCQGSRDLTSASDQYSLGVMLYEMLTGRTPYQAETPLAIIRMQIAGEPLPPPRSLNPNLSEDVERIVLKALAKQPQDRYRTCTQMAGLFEKAVTHDMETRPAAALPQALAFDDGMTLPATPPARRPRRTSGWLWPAVALLILAALGVAALALGWLTLGGGMHIPPTKSAAGTSAPAEVVIPPQPTATGAPWALGADFVYDDFNRDGNLAPGLWTNSCNNPVTQADGALTLGVGQTQESCSEILANPSSKLTVDELGATEARLKIASDFHGTGQAWVSLLLRSRDAPGGHWWAECALMATPGGVTAQYDIQNYGLGKNDYVRSRSASFDRWYTIRLEVDPETMTISCYLDGERIGSAIPSDAEALRTSHFQREIQSWRGLAGGIDKPDAATATAYVDSVRFFPDGFEAAQNQPAPTASETTLYDDFSDPAFDGKFDPRLWVVNSEDEVAQQEGVLVLRQKGKERSALRVELAKYINRSFSVPTFVQADVSLSQQAHAGGITLMVEASRPEDRPSYHEAHCGLNATSEAWLANLFCFDRWVMGADNFDDKYDIPNRNANFSSWHQVRIEVNPATMTITYHLDGELMGEHTMSRADTLKDAAQFTFLVELYTPTAEEIIAFADNVQVGQVSP